MFSDKTAAAVRSVSSDIVMATATAMAVYETEAHFSQVKRSHLSVVTGRFRSILFVSVLRGSLAVAIIVTDGSEKPNRQLGFELQSTHVIENRNNSGHKWIKIPLNGFM